MLTKLQLAHYKECNVVTFDVIYRQKPSDGQNLAFC